MASANGALTAKLIDQRSIGHVQLRMEQDGVAVMRESGSAKCRLPRGSCEAILINTSGGLAGGDAVTIEAEAGEGATLALTSQAAERVYRTLGPAAQVRVKLQCGPGARMFWMPQETIFYEGSSLDRKLDVTMAEDAELLLVEALVFGRYEAGEVVRNIHVRDRWLVKHLGRTIHAEDFAAGPRFPLSVASFADCRASATVVLIAKNADQFLNKVRALIGPESGASAWNGKLVVRVLAEDGFHLRKLLIPVLALLTRDAGLPRCWTF